MNINLSSMDLIELHIKKFFRHLKIKPIFAWYDLWIGIFWDKKKKNIYILPIPAIGLVLSIPPKCPYCKSYMHPIDDVYAECTDCNGSSKYSYKTGLHYRG